MHIIVANLCVYYHWYSIFVYTNFLFYLILWQYMYKDVVKGHYQCIVNISLRKIIILVKFYDLFIISSINFSAEYNPIWLNCHKTHQSINQKGFVFHDFYGQYVFITTSEGINHLCGQVGCVLDLRSRVHLFKTAVFHNTRYFRWK